MAVVLLTPGAGATLAALVSAFPQLIWLSLHRGWVSELPVDCSLLPFGAHARFPADARLAALCARPPWVTLGLYALASVSLALGAILAFVPVFNRP